MRSTRTIATGVVLAAAFAAGSVQAEDRLGDPARGARIYADNCGRCHNARGPREHRDREWSVVVQHMRILAGLPGQQARDVDAFLRANNNPERPTPMPTPERLSGEELIGRYGCRACHVIGGEGGAIGPKLDGIFQRRDEAWIRVQIQRPRENNPQTLMPQPGLSDAEVNAILEVLRASP